MLNCMQISYNIYRFSVFYPTTKVIKIKLHKKVLTEICNDY